MFKRHDWTIFALILILSVIGLFTLLSTNIDIEGNIDLGGVFSRQITFMLVGLVIYFLVSLANPIYLRFPHILVPVYLIIIAVLLYLVVAGPVINTVRRWIIIGGIQVQPSEFAKIIVIFTTASIFSIRNHFDDLLLGVLSFLPQIPILLLIYLEPHGSMTMITLIIWGILVITYMREQRRNILLSVLMLSATLSSLLLLNGNVAIGILFAIASVTILILTSYRIEELRKLLIIVTILGGIVGGVLNFSWNDILKDYQKERIETFFDPEGVDVNQSFNVEQSKVAIGSGGIWGKGFGSGSQSRLQYLPEHQTDFIFATYAEQFGLVGTMVLILLYASLILKCLFYAYKMSSYDLFSSMLIFGLSIKFLVEVFINIGTNTGLIPATGIPLPLLSAGGTNIVVTFFSFGIIQSIISSSQEVFQHELLIDNEDLLI